MSFRKPNFWKDQTGTNDRIQKTQVNQEESESDPESVDGLTFGYLKKNFNSCKISIKSK